MKLRPTPLVLTAAALGCLGIFYIFSGSNLGPPVGFIVILLGGLCLGLYFALQSIFKTKIWTQVAIELVLLFIVCAVIYKFDGKVILRPKRNFQGYIYVVYEVDKQPELKLKNIFRHNIDVAVPDSGIVLTSSPSPDGFMVKLAVADSTKKEVKVMLPGYGIVYAMDTIQCGDKQYRADVFYKGNLSRDWRYRTDTLRRRLKKEQICRMLQ